MFVTLSLFIGFTACMNPFDDDPSAETIQQYIARNRPMITAHRGFAEAAPENTISAFRAALNAGADAAEFDVHRTADGVLVVMHDCTVDRTTNGTGAIASLTYDYIATLDAGSWKGAEFTGEKVPTLFETLTFFHKTNMVAVLEIKVENTVDDILQMLDETKMNNRTVIISFRENDIAQIARERPEIPAFLLLSPDYSLGSTQDKVDNITQKAIEIGTQSVGPFAFKPDSLPDETVEKFEENRDLGEVELPLALDNETISALHEKGYMIDAWTVDNESNMRDLIISNIDFLTTNDLEPAIKIKKELQD